MPLASLSHRLVKKQVKLFILWHFQVLKKLEVELVGQCELFFSVKSFVWSQAGAGGSELHVRGQHDRRSDTQLGGGVNKE